MSFDLHEDLGKKTSGLMPESIQKTEGSLKKRDDGLEDDHYTASEVFFQAIIIYCINIS